MLNNMFIQTESIEVHDDSTIIDYALLSTPRHHEYQGSLTSRVAVLLTDTGMYVHSLDSGKRTATVVEHGP